MAFREVQRVTQWWIWALVLPALVVPFSAFVQQILRGQPFGNNPGPDWLIWVIFILVGLGFPAFLLTIRLTIEVRSDELFVRLSPLRTRRVAYATIARCEARTYRPIREYGGWGIKWGGRNGWVYSLSGNRGVQLEFTDGKRLLIGSSRSVELAEAIRERMPSR